MSGKSFFSPTPTETRVEVPSSPINPNSHSDSDRSPFLSSSSQQNGLQPGETSRQDARFGTKQSESGGGGGSLEGIKALPPILSYCAASITMTVVNKFVLSGTHFSLNLLVLLIQCLVGVILVKVGQKFGLLNLREWNTKDAKAWLPISTLLVFVIWTGSKALQFLKIPVYTIFKNLTIILIAYGEVLWFGGRVTPLTLLSFLLMVLSSLIAAYSDISRTIEISNTALPHSSDDPFSNENQSNLIPDFESLKNEKDNLLNLTGNLGFKNGMQGVLASGYLWMALNCFCSAAYVLAMRKRIKVTGFKDWDTMYFNNLLSIPVLIVMSLLVEDWSKANFEVNFPAETRTRLMSAIVFSGACAIFIAYTTAWCVRTTSSTTYSMVGALNKLPLALSGMVFFGDPVTTGSTSAIGTGFLAGLVYAYAKNKQAQALKAASLAANGHLNGSSTSALGGSGPVAGGVGGERSNESRGKDVIPLHNMSDRDLRKD